MSNHTNRAGTLPERARGLLAPLQAAMLAQQARATGRFAGPKDWLRLTMLGAILMNFAALGLAGAVFGSRTSDDVLGHAAVFGGMMLSIAIVRIGRPAIYLDWLGNGLLCIGLGTILSVSPTLASPALFALFCVLFAAWALLRLWIGVTAGDPTGWLMTSGLIGLFCAGWPMLTHLTGPAADMHLVLFVDLLVHGLSIVGFGLSLRSGK